MAKNWMAYEAAEVLLKGESKEEVAEIGSRFPLFTVAVMRDGTETLVDILKAVSRTSARVVETGLKDADVVVSAEMEETEETSKKTKGVDYESMTSKDLYKECCDRGISSKCKNRKKEALIELLKAHDRGEVESTLDGVEKKNTKEKPAQKKVKEAEEDEWSDDWGEEEDTDPYAGKTAKELYKMCSDRGIKTKPKQSADAYVKLLKKADEEEAAVTEDDGDDDWEI